MRAGRAAILILLAWTAAAAACANGQPPPPSPGNPASEERPAGEPAAPESLAFEPLHQDFYSGLEDRRRAVLRTEAEWRELWNEIAGRQVPPPEPLEVDFELRMVIVAAMGSRPTGGHAIAIESVRAEGDRIVVGVVETSPGAGCMTTQAFTAPVVAVTVEKRPGDAVFVERAVSEPCG